MRRLTAGAGVALRAMAACDLAAEYAQASRDDFAVEAHDHGATFRQIGAALGMPASTARDLVNRTRRDREEQAGA